MSSGGELLQCIREGPLLIHRHNRAAVVGKEKNKGIFSGCLGSSRTFRRGLRCELRRRLVIQPAGGGILRCNVLALNMQHMGTPPDNTHGR